MLDGWMVGGRWISDGWMNNESIDGWMDGWVDEQRMLTGWMKGR